MAGIFASVANILSIAGQDICACSLSSVMLNLVTIAGGNDPEDSALGYFLSAVAITALCLLSFFVLLHLVSGSCCSLSVCPTD